MTAALADGPSLAAHDTTDAERDRYRRWLTGDREAGAALVREHHEYLVAWIARNVDSPHAAHDIAQDVWVQAMRGSFCGRGRFRAWLLCVAKSGICRYHRRRTCFASLTPRTQTSPTRDLLRAEVVDGLEQLTNPKQRSACRAWFLEGLSVEQIATSVGAKPKTVRSRIRLATTKLRSWAA